MYRILLTLFTLAGMLIVAGCTTSTRDKSKKEATAAKKTASTESEKEEAEIRAALDGLDPQDRKLAEAQKWCAVSTDSRLGSMDKPYKIEIEGQPVFLCCGGCAKAAKKNPDKTLATVAELKKKAAAETKTP